MNNQLLWDAYGITNPKKVKSKRIDDKLADIISILRFELHQTKNLTLFSAEVNIRFKTWVFSKNAGHGQFTDEQMEWLQMIRDHIAVSAHIDTDDLEYTPFDSKGGLGKFYKLFGNNYEQLLEEMNLVLVA